MTRDVWGKKLLPPKLAWLGLFLKLPSKWNFGMGNWRPHLRYLQLFVGYRQMLAVFLQSTDGWSVYPMFIEDADHLVCKTYMTRIEGENTRVRLSLARLHRSFLCYSKSLEMLKCSIRLLLHYLKYKTVPLSA